MRANYSPPEIRSLVYKDHQYNEGFNDLSSPNCQSPSVKVLQSSLVNQCLNIVNIKVKIGILLSAELELQAHIWTLNTDYYVRNSWEPDNKIFFWGKQWQSPFVVTEGTQRICQTSSNFWPFGFGIFGYELLPGYVLYVHRITRAANNDPSVFTIMEKPLLGTGGFKNLC